MTRTWHLSLEDLSPGICIYFSASPQFCLGNLVVVQKKFPSAIPGPISDLFVLGHVLLNDGAALLLPFGSVLKRVVEVLVARHAEHAAFLELLGERDDVKVEKSKLSFIPSFGRIKGAASFEMGLVQLVEELLIPVGCIQEETKLCEIGAFEDAVAKSPMIRTT